MLDWYLKYGDNPIRKYLYFEVTSFSYIIYISILLQKLSTLLLLLIVFNYFITKLLSSKLLNGKANEHTDL